MMWDKGLSNTVFACLALAAAQGTLFFMLGLLGHTAGHPNEDAYILFIYSEHLAQDGVISFYRGGPPAEGATDFLWMLLIAGLNVLGLSSGVAAQFLNAIAVFVITLLVALPARDHPKSAYLFFFASLAVASGQFVLAGYVGFSAPLFAALVLLIFVLLTSDKRYFILVPILSIVLGLFRPDGVILGVGFSLVGLLTVDRRQVRPYLLSSAIALGVGVAYFVWRYRYFGEALPLPLLVKSEFEGIPHGLVSNRDWLLTRLGYLVPTVVAVAVLLKPRRAYLLALIPVAIHLVAIGLSEASQNIDFRFQAPAGVILFYLTVLCAAQTFERVNRNGMPATAITAVVVLWALILSAGPDLLRWKNVVAGMSQPNYINVFPMLLSRDLAPDDRIALTEAGRFAYFVRNDKIDLVGLNTPYTAKFGADAPYIAEFDPDLLFFHTTEVIDLSCDGAAFCEINPATLEVIVRAAGLPPATEVIERTRRAALASLEFILASRDRYTIFASRFNGRYDHVYALSDEASLSVDEFRRLLAESHDSPRRWSYTDGVNLFLR